ncbi:MAG: amidohydrolase family protein, partial [Treponema sp.]|nr:amidohydrolase family protein [Treponema sp.]
MRIVLKNFRIVDEETDMTGQVLIDEGIITSVLSGQDLSPALKGEAAMIIDGRSVSHSGNGLPVLMPAFVDLHAHFRDPGFPEKETLESASLAAVAGGFGTVVCMANTKPVIDSPEKVRALKKRSEALALIDLYPVMSLTRGMEGKELSELGAILPRPAGDALAAGWEGPLALSEDGKDLADDSLFLAAMGEAKRIGIPISCHCDFGGDEAEVAKNAGQPRSMWSRIEENNAVRRVIELGKKAGCHIHIAHVSTKEAAEMIRRAKAELAGAAPNGNRSTGSFKLTCEVMPHNLCLTEEDARRLGDESWGRVNPPLHSEEDRKALIRALADGIIDAIATDHAPHSNADKEKGTPGFSGFETAFA